MVEVGDEIDIELVQDSNNTAGLDGKGYNGNFIVDGIIDAYQFTFQNTDTNGVREILEPLLIQQILEIFSYLDSLLRTTRRTSLFTDHLLLNHTLKTRMMVFMFLNY